MTLRHHTPGVPPTEDTSAGAATFQMAGAYTCVCEEEPGGAQEQPGAAQEQPGAAQEQPRRSPEATFDVFLAGRGGPKVQKLRFGSILTTILGQQHTEICSKSDFWHKF